MKLSRVARPVLIPWLATIAGLAVPAIAWHRGSSTDLGTLVIYTFTFIAILWYTHFTYRLLVKRGEASVSATIRYVPENLDVRVPVTNLSARYLRVRVWADARVNGQQANLGPDYSGGTVWQLTPSFGVEGHFGLNDVVGQLGETFHTMRAVANDQNQTSQLRLALRAVYQVGGFPEFAGGRLEGRVNA